MPAQMKPKSFESRQNAFLYPNLLEGADRVGGQLRADKDCPLSGVTSSGRVWKKGPEAMLGVWVIQ